MLTVHVGWNSHLLIINKWESHIRMGIRMQTRLLAIIRPCDHIAAAFEGKTNLLLKVALWKNSVKIS